MSTKISPYLKGNVLEATIVEEKPKSYVVKTPDGKICSIPKFRSMSNWKEIDFKNTKTPQKFVLSDWVVKGYFECVREGEKFSFQTGSKTATKPVGESKSKKKSEYTITRTREVSSSQRDVACSSGKKSFFDAFDEAYAFAKKKFTELLPTAEIMGVPGEDFKLISIRFNKPQKLIWKEMKKYADCKGKAIHYGTNPSHVYFRSMEPSRPMNAWGLERSYLQAFIDKLKDLGIDGADTLEVAVISSHSY